MLGFASQILCCSILLALPFLCFRNWIWSWPPEFSACYNGKLCLLTLACFVASFRSLNLLRPKEETLSKHSILGPNGLYGQWQPPKSDKGVWWYLPNSLVLTKKLCLHFFSYCRCNIQATLTWLQLNSQGQPLYRFSEYLIPISCWSQVTLIDIWGK